MLHLDGQITVNSRSSSDLVELVRRAFELGRKDGMALADSNGIHVPKVPAAKKFLKALNCMSLGAFGTAVRSAYKQGWWAGYNAPNISQADIDQQDETKREGLRREMAEIRRQNAARRKAAKEAAKAPVAPVVEKQEELFTDNVMNLTFAPSAPVVEPVEVDNSADFNRRQLTLVG